MTLDTRSMLASVGANVDTLADSQMFKCPVCSHTRKKKNEKCLSVKSDADGYAFKYHHCGWHGGHRLTKRHASQPSRNISKVASDFPLQLWTEATSALGTRAERYLASRQLVLPDRHEEVLRFHPSCPFGKGVRLPCMVALYRDIWTNEPKAIHRTALTPDGNKIDRKALGPKGGCAIKLSADENVTEGLTIAEGIETALAGMALNFRPTWAVGDAGEVAKFPVLPGIECLTILVDNDANGTGQSRALECSRRWTSMGREVFRIVPTEVGADMADVISGRAA